MRVRLMTGAALAALLAVSAGAGNYDAKFERARMKDILRTVDKDVAKNFYDPAFKGVDWKAAVKDAEARIDRSETAGEMITAIFSLVAKLDDSHTMFLPPNRVGKPRFGFNAKAYGDQFMVYEVYKKSAADKAGLKPGDRLLTVNGFGLQRASFGQMMLFFRAIRPVSALEIQYVRGEEPPAKLTLTAEMKQATVVTDMTDDFNIWELVREAENESAENPFHTFNYSGGVGYLHLPHFTGDTGFLHYLARKLKDPKAVIVDLRGNPGGAVRGLEELSGHFVQKSTLMADVKLRTKNDTITAVPRSPSFPGPVYVLIDSDSASAAEIFARHFQRNGATVIGDKSSGRVNVARFFSEQIGVDTIVPFGVEISVGQLTMGDEMLEGRGVTPDKACLPTAADLRDDKDPCLHMALALAREKIGVKIEEEDDTDDTAPGSAQEGDETSEDK